MVVIYVIVLSVLVMDLLVMIKILLMINFAMKNVGLNMEQQKDAFYAMQTLNFTQLVPQLVWLIHLFHTHVELVMGISFYLVKNV